MITTTSKVQKLFQSPNTDWIDVEKDRRSVALICEWGVIEASKATLQDFYEESPLQGKGQGDIISNTPPQFSDVHFMDLDNSELKELMIEFCELHPEKIDCRPVDGKEYMSDEIVDTIESIPFKSIKWA